MRQVGASKAANGGIVDYRKKFCVKSGEKVRLDKLDPSYTGKLASEDAAKDDVKGYLKELAHQQVLLYA